MPEGSIHHPTGNELALADWLREQVVDRISELDPTEVQASLGLAKSGLERLLVEQSWGLKKAFRAADLLGLPVVETIVNKAEAVASKTSPDG